jgi:hypothetical protein
VIAIVKGDVWTVTGKDLPPDTLGGVAEAEKIYSPRSAWTGSITIARRAGR